MTLVLMVDDDPLIADVVRAALKPLGYTVGVVSDGRAVLEIVEFKRPALVILDCAMPLMPGIEVLRRIRTSRTASSVPVLMLTARSSAADREIGMRAGASFYMKKPFDADQLAAVVDDLVRENASTSGHRAARSGYTRHEDRVNP